MMTEESQSPYWMLRGLFDCLTDRVHVHEDGTAYLVPTSSTVYLTSDELALIESLLPGVVVRD